MKSSFTLVDRFRRSLEKIPSNLRTQINCPGGLSESELLDLIMNPRDQSVYQPAPVPPAVVKIDYDIQQANSLGEKIINQGKVAYCIMTEIIDTRNDSICALSRIPDIDMSLLTLKIFQAVGPGPIWIIVSPSSRQRIIDHVNSQTRFDLGRIRFVDRYESYRLEPDNQILFVDGRPDLYSCGSGDLFPALIFSGVLSKFIETGGRYISVVDVRNVAGSLDSVTIGRHALMDASVSYEVVEGSLGDSNSAGVLCDVNGSYQIVEDIRIFDTDCNHKNLKWFDTNSLIFNASLNIAPLGRSWNRIRKNVNGRLVVQHERLLQEITEAYNTTYFGVAKSERFVLVKNANDLLHVNEFINANKQFI